MHHGTLLATLASTEVQPAVPTAPHEITAQPTPGDAEKALTVAANGAARPSDLGGHAGNGAVSGMQKHAAEENSDLGAVRHDDNLTAHTGKADDGSVGTGADKVGVSVAVTPVQPPIPEAHSAGPHLRATTSSEQRRSESNSQAQVAPKQAGGNCALDYEPPAVVPLSPMQASGSGQLVAATSSSAKEHVAHLRVNEINELDPRREKRIDPKERTRQWVESLELLPELEAKIRSNSMKEAALSTAQKPQPAQPQRQGLFTKCFGCLSHPPAAE